MEFNLDSIIKAIVDLLNKILEILEVDYVIDFAKPEAPEAAE